MTYPLPKRLAPVRAEVQQRKVLIMLAVLAFLLALFAGFGAHVGNVSPTDLLCFAVSALSLHFAWDVPLRRQG